MLAVPCGAQTKQDAKPPKEEKKQPPADQRSGPGKVLGLPTPVRDKSERDSRLVLPSSLRKPTPQSRTKKGNAQKPPPTFTDNEGPLADFVASLVSEKQLSSAELVAEYSLLSDNDRRALTMRAHRLTTLAVVRLARVFRAIPEPSGVPALLTVLRSRKTGKYVREIVDNALFLSGDKARLVGLDLLTCKYKGVRDAVVPLLASILQKNDLSQLYLLLAHRLQGARLAALDVLAAWLADHPEEDTASLVRCLRHKDGTLRTQAARHLGARGAAVVPALVAILENPPEDGSFFLAALLVAKRELLTGKELIPAQAIAQLGRHRFGAEVMPRGVAFLVASLRWFRDPEGFKKKGGGLAAVSMPELVEALLDVAQVRGFYPEFPLCHDTALLGLRLLSGEDFGGDHRRWRAWWKDGKARFRPLRADVRLDAATVGHSRLSYRKGGKLEFVLLGEQATEPPAELGGFRCRVSDGDFLALEKVLRSQQFLDVAQRLAEVKSFVEGHSLVLEGPQGRARDGFANQKSLRLRVLLNVLERTLEEQSWQQFVPARLDEAGRRAWWRSERDKLDSLASAPARRAHILDLALQALPSLGPDARRRAIGSFLEEAARKDSKLGAGHAAALLAVVEGKDLESDEKRSLFEVLSLIGPAPFRDVLTALGKQKGLDLQDVLRRMLAVAGTDRVLVALRHPEPRIRAGAAAQVDLLGGPRTTPILIESLSDEDFEVRTRAAESCGRLRLMAARPKVLGLLKDTETVVRQAAMLALARIGGEDTYQILLRAADPNRPSERLTAVHALTLLRDTRAGFALADLAAAHHGSPIGMMALAGLRKRGGKVLRAKVWTYLRASVKPTQRRELTFLLAEMGDPGVLEQLLRMLEAGASAAQVCRLVAGITGIDYCGNRDRVKRYRDWSNRNASTSPAAWLLEAMAHVQMQSPLVLTQLVPGAPVPVIDELCRVIEDSRERDWPLRALANNVLRDVTGKDFGAIHQRTNLGARQAITERFRQYARVRDGAKRK